MKICIQCNQLLSLTEFTINKKHTGNYKTICKACIRTNAAEYNVKDPFTHRCRVKKAYSKKHNLPFNLTPEYLKEIFTGYCPIFNTKISIGNRTLKHAGVGHLDRIVPELGYVKGNVAYVSARANVIKNNATVDELRKIADWMDFQIKSATTIPNGSTLETIASGSGEPIEI